MADNTQFQAGRKRRRGPEDFNLYYDERQRNVSAPVDRAFRPQRPPVPRPPRPTSHLGYTERSELFTEQAELMQTNLIVNYLPQALSDEELIQMFSPYGTIDIQTSRIMRDKKTGYSFGYGFINFHNPSSANLAISVLNGLQVMNKVIKVSYARPASSDIKDTNVYITNLPRSTTDVDLTHMFGQFGNIVQKNILYDKITQLPRGVAFVRYDRREEANAAIQAMNGFVPSGSDEPIKVRLAEDHGKQKANYLAGFQAGYRKRF